LDIKIKKEPEEDRVLYTDNNNTQTENQTIKSDDKIKKEEDLKEESMDESGHEVESMDEEEVMYKNSGYTLSVDKRGKEIVELEMFPFSDEEEEKGPEIDDWNVKHCPKKVSDIVGNKKWVDLVVSWMKQHKENTLLGKNRKVTIPMGMILAGPYGCGKTSLVYAICEEFGYQVEEINPTKYINSISVNEKKLKVDKGNTPKEFITALIRPIMVRKRALWEEKPTAILIEQADILGQGDDFYTSLAELLKPPYQVARNSTGTVQAVSDDDVVNDVTLDGDIQWSPPIFLTTNDPFCSKLKVLKKEFVLREKPKKKASRKAPKEDKRKIKIVCKYFPCEIAYMDKVSEKDIVSRLITICRRENIFTAGLDVIAQSAFGDVRRAVTLLNISARNLDISKQLDKENVIKVCETFADSDVFSLGAEKQAKQMLSKPWTIIQLQNSTYNNSFLTDQYLWYNIPDLIEDNYGRRKHPFLKVEHCIPLLKNKKIIDWKRETFRQSAMDIMSEIEESWATASIFEKDGGWRDYSMSEYQDLFQTVKPCYLTKYIKENGVKETGNVPFKLAFPKLGINQQISKNENKHNSLYFRTGISKDQVGYYAKIWVRKLLCWRDGKKEFQILVDGMRDMINIHYFKWKAEKDNEIESDDLCAEFYLNKYDWESESKKNTRIFKLPEIIDDKLTGEYNEANPFKKDEQEIVETDGIVADDADRYAFWQEKDKAMMDMFDEVREAKEKIRAKRPSKTLDLEKEQIFGEDIERLRNQLAELLLINGFFPSDLTLFENHLNFSEHPKEMMFAGTREEIIEKAKIGFGDEFSKNRIKVIGLKERMKKAMEIAEKYGMSCKIQKVGIL
jgi:DNA polymerase III delta prime subunit